LSMSYLVIEDVRSRRSRAQNPGPQVEEGLVVLRFLELPVSSVE
jgi:hypothetical protein